MHCLFFLSFDLAASLSGTFADSKAFVSYLNNPNSGYRNTDWMKTLPDDTPVTQITIPATQASLGILGNDYQKTQSLSIKEQLLSGIRFLDLVLRVENEYLIGYSLGQTQTFSFAAVMKDVFNFLEKHPHEMIILQISNGLENQKTQISFERRFRNVVQRYQTKFFFPTDIQFNLGDARNKFMFIQKFKANKSYGITTQTFSIQNFWDLFTRDDLYLKWKLIQNHFYQTQHMKTFSLNYISGSGDVEPFFVASGKRAPNTNASQLISRYSTKKWTSGEISQERTAKTGFVRLNISA